MYKGGGGEQEEKGVDLPRQRVCRENEAAERRGYLSSVGRHVGMSNGSRGGKGGGGCLPFWCWRACRGV